jgi:putative transposase
MLKGVKIRLYPNGTQEQQLNSLLGAYRFVYNQSLSYKDNLYKNQNTKIKMNELSKYFHSEMKANNPWISEHNTKVLKQSIRDLDQSYQNFFKLNKGFPQYKSKHDVQHARFPLEAVAKDTFKNDKLNLTTKIKDLNFSCSDKDRKYLLEYKLGIKSVTITKTKTDKYFASILIDGIVKTKQNPINNIIGIDLGIKSLMVMSDGEVIDNPKFIRNNEKQLKRLHKQLSRKQKGSNNRKKAKLKLAIKHEKIKNQKTDYIHKLTDKIISENQTIVLEDLNVSGMMKNHNLAKSIQELGLHEIKRQLEYKSKWYNRDLIFIDRYYPSSKKCSCCGEINKDLKLSDRVFKCKSCHFEIDRDLNAALNIEKEGLRLYKEIIRQRLPEYKLVEYPLMDERLATDLRSYDTVKQEVRLEERDGFPIFSKI